MLSNNGVAYAAQQYLHTQGSTATTWSVPHGLGTLYPVIEAYDNTDTKIDGYTVTPVDANNTNLVFATSRTGSAKFVG